MHRFYLKQSLQEGSFVLLDEAIVHQLKSVLKMQAGEEVVLFSDADGLAGWDFHFHITRFDASGISGEIISKIRNDREPKISLVLFQSVLKKDNMELIFQKGTEVGITRYVPILSQRSVKTGVNSERAAKILKEATEQSGRAFVPELNDTVSFADAVSQVKEDGALTIFAHEDSSAKRLEGVPLSSQRVNLFIGPEGGFTEREVETARAAGFYVVVLSRRTLRAETAAITASYFVLHRFGF